MAVLLGIDFETTGTNPETDQVIEAGWVKWCTDRNIMIDCGSFLCYTRNTVVLDEIRDLTTLDADVLEQYCGGEDFDRQFEAEVLTCDYLVAHNANFEKGFLKNLYTWVTPFEELEWIDTFTDVPYPKHKGPASLGALAQNHGILNPMPHRALPDALTMMLILSQYDFQEILAYRNEPITRLFALVSYGDNDKAKAIGYKWDSEKRIWFQDFRARHLDAGLLASKDAGFRAVELEEADAWLAEEKARKKQWKRQCAT